MKAKRDTTSVHDAQQSGLIGIDGSLFVKVPAQEASWYRFLAASRTAVSTHGGWNSKSYWRIRAVERLTRDPAVIRQWTRNSLTENEPKPRRKDFRLSREMSEERAGVRSGMNDQSENWINATLFERHSSKWDKRFMGDVRFFGYEIPLGGEKARMLRIDLLGEIGNTELAVVELKRGKGSDSPLMAFAEAVCYGLQLIRCKNDLIPELKAIGVDWDGARPVHLILAAPETYWKSWIGPDALNGGVDHLLGQFESLVAAVNQVLEEDKMPRLKLRLNVLADGWISESHPSCGG